MITHSNPIHWLRISGLALMTSFSALNAASSQVQLTKDGTAQSVIVVPAGSLHWPGDDQVIDQWGRIKGLAPLDVDKETQRRLQRDSIRDLAMYLEKISGAPVEIVESLAPGDQRVPIYIGPAAEAVFGPVGIDKAGKYGFRVIAGAKGIGLYGQSEHGTSYAIYELLDRLGCRWYLPSGLGESILPQKTIRVDFCDDRLAPATEFRDIQSRTADKDFLRRNRMGGTRITQHHTLETYVSEEQRAAHPEWRLQVDGVPDKTKLRWTRPDVAEAIADKIISQLDAAPSSSVSLSPGDYVVPTEDPEERKHDPEPRVWESAAGRWSVTDRLMMLSNRVAESVTKKYPDTLFGVLAYVNYNMPPAREPVHPNVVPIIAPIDFNRHHPMNWPDHPNGSALKDLVEGWGRKAKRWGYYAYGMNLAEISAPNPFITKWGTDLPILLENGMTYWTPETMGGWESMMPGYYLSIRLTFDPKEKPATILDEMWQRLYGPAAEPMGAYWNLMDRAWIDAKEYAGAHFGYLKIFTPEVLAKARQAINAALAAPVSSLEYQRIKMIEESLAQLELFMKMREDYAAGRLKDLKSDLEKWLASLRHLQRRYKDQYAFGFPYAKSTMTENYVTLYCGASYEDASRMEQEFKRAAPPITDWKWKHNPGPEADSLPWTAAEFDDKDWPQLNVVRDTWSSLGHHSSLTEESTGRSGRMAYRTNIKLPTVPAGKRAWLWLAATDGTAKVFVNGKPIPYVVPAKTRKHDAGTVLEAFEGFCEPARFDITDALKPGANQITILCDRNRLWELGTGGLIGPAAVFFEK